MTGHRNNVKVFHMSEEKYPKWLFNSILKSNIVIVGMAPFTVTKLFSNIDYDKTSDIWIVDNDGITTLINGSEFKETYPHGIK